MKKYIKKLPLVLFSLMIVPALCFAQYPDAATTHFEPNCPTQDAPDQHSYDVQYNLNPNHTSFTFQVTFAQPNNPNRNTKFRNAWNGWKNHGEHKRSRRKPNTMQGHVQTIKSGLNTNNMTITIKVNPSQMTPGIKYWFIAAVGHDGATRNYIVKMVR